MGVGWGRADFSQHASAEEVLKTLKDVGRNSNSIRYFFNLSVGDIVVVPLYRAIAIGIVSGNKRFVLNLLILMPAIRYRLIFSVMMTVKLSVFPETIFPKVCPAA